MKFGSKKKKIVLDHWNKLLDDGLKQVITKIFNKTKDITKVKKIRFDYLGYSTKVNEYISFSIDFDKERNFGLSLITHDGTTYTINPMVSGELTEQEINDYCQIVGYSNKFTLNQAI